MSDKQHQSSYPAPTLRNARGGFSITAGRRGGGSEPAAGADLISPTFLLWVLHQWWKIAMPVGLILAAVAAAVVLYTYVPKYRAQAMLMIEDTSPYIAFANGGGRGSQRYIQTQLELLKSPVVLEPVLSRKEIASLPDFAYQTDRVETLRKKLDVQPIGGSELYDVSYESTSPETAATVVNAVIREYMDLQAGDEFQRSQRVIELLEEERRRRALEVERLRKRVVDLAKEVTGKDPFSGSIVSDKGRTTTPIAEIFSELTSLDVEHAVLAAQQQSINDSAAIDKDPLESSGLLELEIENHEAVSQRLAAISAIKAQMEEVETRAVRYMNNPTWQNDPTFIGLQKELERLEKEVVEVKSKAREIVLKQRSQQRKYDREMEISKLEMQRKGLEIRREMLTKQFGERIDDVKLGGGKNVELEFARAELEREEKVFELIASRKLAMQTELRAPARVNVRQEARVPIMPIEEIPYKILLVACSAAFAAPFAVAVGREATVRRISDVGQLAQESRLRVLGEIAALPVRHVAISPNKLTGRLRKDAYIFAESINSLRTNMAVADNIGLQQVIAVTSALSSEGKSSVATSLAMSIANATESPTLIIDADMRAPDVSKMLKTRSTPGLFEFLSHKCSLEAAIHRVGDSNIYVIPGGRATRSPHHIVRSTEINEMLTALREKFSSIVIDTPPILGASESLVLARAADAALFCSLCDVSRVKQVRLAVDRLEHAGVNVAGAILSGTPASRYAYTYGCYATQMEFTS